MYLICGNSDLRAELVQKLGLSDDQQRNRVFSSFTVLPTVGSVTVAVNDLTDGNLRFVIRYFLANAEKNLKFSVIKRQWSDSDIDQLDEAIRAEFRRACEENQRASQKIARLPSSSWKNERMEQLRRWQTIPSLNYSTYSAIVQLFDDNMVQLSVLDRSVTNKPPVLHWTPMPLDMELQVAIQFTFPLVAPDQSTFVDICKSIGAYFNSTYEWTDGVLLTSEMVRLHVERVSENEIELAARVCTDDLEEEQSVTPAKLLWPFLAAALKCMLKHLEVHDFLQYNIELIIYGSSFFDPPLHGRVFDFFLFMGTASEYGKVGFRHQDRLYNIQFKELLPDGHFTSLSRLLTLEPPRPHRTTQQLNSIDETTVVPNNNRKISAQPMSNLAVSHNRGRRVSFGSIKLMNDSTPPVKGVDDYVDAMLKQTMDHLIL
ncbi:hypothetical protein Q1695_005346 [Nippostrongylus brasiliensis]|nr:hypothetical protein Q1695_005346 [Nippostrongylus brasiliensis]